MTTLIRFDKGTENVLIEAFQKQRRSDRNDELGGQKSFINGRSVRNQRIEAYLGQMRQHSADFYI